MEIRRTVLVRCCMAALVVIVWGDLANGQPAATPSGPVDLWALAKEKQQSHRFSTIITAQQVRDHLAKADGLEAALQWCRQTAVTKVYIESFRDGYRAQRAAVERARDRFREAGFEVSGCVTTTQVGKKSTGWNVISCYTDRATQDKLQDIFASTAELFDEIMIDDFWFYVEQARQTVLGGAHESVLFCYGSLLEHTGPKNVTALSANIPELFSVAEQVRRRQIVGIAAYKPPSSPGENEQRVFDFVGMLGLPLVPCQAFPADAKAAFFSVHALKDPQFVEKLTAFIDAGRPVLLTDGLAQKLAGKVKLDVPTVQILPVKGNPKSLLEMSQADLDRLRGPLLAPLSRRFEAPNRVALYVFADGSWVVENFRDESATVKLDGKLLTVAPRNWAWHWQ